MMRVRARQTLQQANLHVRPVVAVGIFQKPQLRQRRHNHAAAPELKPRHTVKFVGKNDTAISHSIPVIIRQTQNAVVSGFGRIPVRITGPYRHKQATVRVDGHLHRVNQFREHLLRCKHAGFQTFVQLHLFQAVGGTQVGKAAVRQIALLVGTHNQFFRQVVVPHVPLTALSDRPDPLITVGRHHVKDFHLTHHHVGVGLTKPRQFGTATKHVVTIHHPVPIEPVVVLIKHGLTQFLQRLFSLIRQACEQLLHDDLCHSPVAVLQQMNAVHRQGPLSLRVEFLRGIKQIDKRNFLPGTHLLHGLRIGVQSFVVV